MNDLKPCPFCGTSERVHARVTMGDQQWYHVECAHCDSKATNSKSLERAKAAWNRRAGDGLPCILDENWNICPVCGDELNGDEPCGEQK